MTNNNLFMTSILVLGLTFAGGETSSWAASSGHEGHAATELTLTLNAGAKWQGDENMIKGMDAIRKAVASHIPAIHDQTLPPEGYRSLSQNIQKEVDFMLVNCKLAPEVDEQFHMVLIQVLDGVSALQEGPDPQAGAVKIVTALNAYGDYFVHPGWQPLE